MYVPGWMDYLFGFRYPPYDKRHVSKLTVNGPGFKRGEGIESQIVGGGKTKKLLGRIGMWVVIAVGLALVDTRIGGRSRLWDVWGGLSG